MRTTAYIIAAGISAMALTSCGKVIKVHTDKDRIIKEIQAEQAFNAIESYGTTDIVYVDGPAKITLTAGKNQIDEISVFVKDSILVVTGPEQNGGNNIFKGDTESKLTVSYPSLRPLQTRIQATGRRTGDIKIAPANDLAIVLNTFGTGDIDSKSLKCTRLFAQTGGTGNISLGHVACTDAELYTHGTGDIDISDINAGNIKAQTNGTGDITIAGTCRSTDFSESGVGDINARKLKTVSE